MPIEYIHGAMDSLHGAMDSEQLPESSLLTRLIHVGAPKVAWMTSDNSIKSFP